MANSPLELSGKGLLFFLLLLFPFPSEMEWGGGRKGKEEGFVPKDKTLFAEEEGQQPPQKEREGPLRLLETEEGEEARLFC